jgi:RNA ligase (TIGR02306 family)
MSTFIVPILPISKVWHHPNADRLDLANVEGMTWQFVVGRDEYKPGDLVVYIPIDSVLPPDLIEFLGVGNFLAGSQKNRVKTARLRGELSQGLVVQLEKLVAFKCISFDENMADIREYLGIEKYDPPPIMSKSGNLVRMPEHVSVFDVEGADNYPDVVEVLMDEPVIVTEKLEGTNWWCSAAPDGEEWVGQRNYAIQEVEGDKENVYWACARKQGLLEFAKRHAAEHGCFCTLRGELLGPGIQKNYYEYPDFKVHLFGMQENREYLPSLRFFEECLKLPLDPPSDKKMPRIPWVPKLISIGENQRAADCPTLRQWLDGATIQAASNGKSMLHSKKLREGIVVVPATEQHHSRVGRLMIKMRSPDYLAKTDF